MPASVATSSGRHHCRSRGSTGAHAAGNRIGSMMSLLERSRGNFESAANTDPLQTLSSAYKRFLRSSIAPVVESVQLPLPAAGLSDFVFVSPGRFEVQLGLHPRDSSPVPPANRHKPRLSGSISETVHRYI